MLFFSGFCLHGEAVLFEDFLCKSDFCVSGFSLGAIEAFEYTVNSTRRIDRLQLFSPAFFHAAENTYKRMQLLYFKKDQAQYVKNFLKNAAYPSQKDLSRFYHDDSVDNLGKLLNFHWSKEKLQTLLDRGVMIDVYLGEEDKIIDAKKAKIFFKEFATVYTLKNAGHILQKDKNG